MRRLLERAFHSTVCYDGRANSCRYISQVRQETAIRLHARLYPGGEGPSKVSPQRMLPVTRLTVSSGGLALREESSWGRAFR